MEKWMEKFAGKLLQAWMCILPRQNASDIVRRTMLNSNSKLMEIVLILLLALGVAGMIMLLG